MRCLMWLHQWLCSTDMSWESVSTGFEFGYFRGLLLPYLVQYFTKLLRTLFSEFCSVAEMPLWHILREYMWPAQTKDVWWHILVWMSGLSSAIYSNFNPSLIACLPDPTCIILSWNGKSLTWWIKMLRLLCIWNKFSRKGKNLQFLGTNEYLGMSKFIRSRNRFS